MTEFSIFLPNGLEPNKGSVSYKAGFLDGEKSGAEKALRELVGNVKTEFTKECETNFVFVGYVRQKIADIAEEQIKELKGENKK